MKEINIAIVGCGSRGVGNTLTVMMADKGVNIVAVCDPRHDKMDKAVYQKEGERP